MYKLIKELKPSGKMSVTPQQSEALQRALFKMGNEWFPCNRDVLFVKYNHHIYWENKTILISGDGHLFDLDENPLHKFEEHFKEE